MNTVSKRKEKLIFSFKRYLAYSKVRKVIESCQSYSQLKSADNMIDNFKALYGLDNAYSRSLDKLWFERNNETLPCKTEWQPCGRANQELNNAEQQLEMIENDKKHVYGC